MDKDLSARIDAANDEFLSDEPAKVREAQVAVPLRDMHRQQVNRAREYNRKPRINGSTQKVLVDLQAVLANLTPHYQKAKDDSEKAAKLGDMEGARILSEQYMRDIFLPAIEALVRSNSPEEVLNSTKALSEVDKYVLTAGGRPDGYTAALVSKLYESDMGNIVPTSDIDVQRAVQSLVGLVQNDQIRAAVGLASKIKARIDAGEHSASKEDYELIQKIALRGQ